MDELVERIQALGVTPNAETGYCRAWRRTLGAYTGAYDSASQGLWYLANGIAMVPTRIDYGEKHIDTRLSCIIVTPPGGYKDGLINGTKESLETAILEARIETLEVSHEEQLRGSRVPVKISVERWREPTPDEVGEATEKGAKDPKAKIPVVTVQELWITLPGILGDDFAYMPEGADLINNPEYRVHQRYLRTALNPYGENASPKRLTGKSYASRLRYYPPVVIIIAFQPEELTDKFVSSGLARRFITLLCSPSEAMLDRITTRSILGALDETKDMGVFDETDEEVAQAHAVNQLRHVARKFWGRPYNQWLIDWTKPEEQEIAELFARLLETGKVEKTLDESTFQHLEKAAEEMERWKPREILRLTPVAQKEMLSVFNHIMERIIARGDVARQYALMMKTTVVSLLARMAGITAGVRIANGAGKTQVEPEDVLACALDLRTFLDMGLGLVLGTSEKGEPFKKTIKDDVVWVRQHLAERGADKTQIPAGVVRDAYDAEAKTHRGWRMWDRVRRDLRQLGFVEPLPAGLAKEDAYLKLTQTGLATAVAGAKPVPPVGKKPGPEATGDQKDEDQIW